MFLYELDFLESMVQWSTKGNYLIAILLATTDTLVGGLCHSDIDIHLLRLSKLRSYIHPLPIPIFTAGFWLTRRQPAC